MTTQLRTKLLAKRALLRRLQQAGHGKPVQSGFTLIELLIVVVILGILASIGVPALINQQRKAVAQANNTLAMSTARACAAFMVAYETGDTAPANPANVSGTCDATAGGTFTADKDATKASAAVATASSPGGVELTTASAPI